MNHNLAYFNGFLETFGILNCKANLVSAFYLENKSILSNLNLTKNITQFYPENYNFEFNNIENWHKEVKT